MAMCWQWGWPRLDDARAFFLEHWAGGWGKCFRGREGDPGVCFSLGTHPGVLLYLSPPSLRATRLTVSAPPPLPHP